MLPLCNNAAEEKWHDERGEIPETEEKDLVHPTKEHELEWIASRVEAA